MQRTITDSGGQVVARLDEGYNSMLFVYTRGGRCLGYYNQVTDKTYDSGGNYNGPGDQRMTLIDED